MTLNPQRKLPYCVGRLARLTSIPSYQVLAEDSMLVTWSERPVTGSVTVQGSTPLGQTSNGEFTPSGELRRNLPIRKRLPKLWMPSTETVQFWPNCCCAPTVNCCT